MYVQRIYVSRDAIMVTPVQDFVHLVSQVKF